MGKFRGDADQRVTNSHFQSTASSWREIYNKSDLSSLLYQESRNVVLSLVDELGWPGERVRVLDIGCGPGLTSVALAKRGHFVDAIDSVPAMIDMTRKLGDESHVGHLIQTRVCDICTLSFPDNFFDLVLVVGVTEWLDSLARPMREITRVLKPGGFLILTGDNSWSLHFVFDPLMTPMVAPLKRWVHSVSQRFGGPPRPRYHLRSVWQLDASIRAAGLQEIRRMTLGFGPFSLFGRKLLGDSAGLRLHEWFQGLAERDCPVLRSTGHVYIVVASKPGGA